MLSPGIPANISELTGPLFIGILFNWALFGALSVQAYIYYLAFPRDRIFPTKSLVLFVYIYEAIQTFVITRDGFKYFASGWGDMDALNEVGWVWISVPVMTGVVSAVTQIFYGWRIWILSQRVYIPVFVVSIALAQGGAGIWTGVSALRTGVWSELQHLTSLPTTLWLAGTAICDVAVAVSMLYYLSRSRNGFQQTNALLVKLIRITVETGLITAIVAVIDLALFLAYKEANYHLTPAIALSKLYSNSLIVLLNARIRVVGGRNTGTANHDSTLGHSSWSANLDRLTMGPSFAHPVKSYCLSADGKGYQHQDLGTPRHQNPLRPYESGWEADSKENLDNYGFRTLGSYQKSVPEIPPLSVEPFVGLELVQSPSNSLNHNLPSCPHSPAKALAVRPLPSPPKSSEPNRLPASS